MYAHASNLDLKGGYDYSHGWYHRVEKGDTLAKVADKYNRSAAFLARLNGLNPQKPLKQGSYIYIPPIKNKDTQKAPDKTPPKVEKTKEIVSAEKYKSSPPQSPDPDSKSSSVSRKASSKGFIWPLEGKITKDFSNSKDSPHKGMDIAAKQGVTVVAAKSGKVIYCDDGIPGYGKLIIIDHEDKISSVYAHNSELLVKVGQYVAQGTPIARVGSTGRSNGPHLHFEIRRNAIPGDPRKYLP
jgi:murein DD-endopeptidase MepM/ murein hydrolase activator NlpD